VAPLVQARTDTRQGGPAAGRVECYVTTTELIGVRAVAVADGTENSRQAGGSSLPDNKLGQHSTLHDS
jgi:hypothetical protein